MFFVGGGHSNTTVAHMRDQRKMKKRVFFFFRLNAIRANHGQNVPVFKKKKKKGPFFECF